MICIETKVVTDGFERVQPRPVPRFDPGFRLVEELLVMARSRGCMLQIRVHGVLDDGAHEPLLAGDVLPAPYPVEIL